MAETLYTIPVNDAFDQGSECPVCSMRSKLEEEGIAFVLGPSYMDDEVRAVTDEKGFCDPHMRMLLAERNRLGLSLILKTQFERQVRAMEVLKKKPIRPKSLLKKQEESEIGAFLKRSADSCYLCDRINETLDRYLRTTVLLYEKDEAFRNKYRNSKGFCIRHAGMLVETAREKLSGKKLEEFAKETVRLYSENLKRLSDDLDWFQNKFDYRYQNEPWKNSKDAVERAAAKSNGILPK